MRTRRGIASHTGPSAGTGPEREETIRGPLDRGGASSRRTERERDGTRREPHTRLAHVRARAANTNPRFFSTFFFVFFFFLVLLSSVPLTLLPLDLSFLLPLRGLLVLLFSPPTRHRPGVASVRSLERTLRYSLFHCFILFFMFLFFLFFLSVGIIRCSVHSSLSRERNVFLRRYFYDRLSDRRA